MTETEFPFTDKEFAEIRRLIHARAGISLNAGKKPMVYSRLARRLRELQLDSFANYLVLLKCDVNEWESFTNALTTNLTSFFREAHHFDTLATLAPHWLQQYGSLAIWSSAASTGEEPYSIAMTLAESLGSLSPPVRVLASDLDTQVLAKAQAGIYALDKLDKLDIARKRRFFLRGKGRHEGWAKVRDELRQLITFQQINLLDSDWPLQGRFDAIFCRNVMIYFDKPTQRVMLERFLSLLRPEGRLFVGHSESLGHVAHWWEPCGRTVYRPRRSS